LSIQIETLDHPFRYSTSQLERARRLAELLCRERIVLCETPAG